MEESTNEQTSTFEYNFEDFLENLGNPKIFLDASLPHCYGYWWYAVPILKIFRCLDFSLPASLILGEEIKYIPGKKLWEFDGTYLPDDVIAIIQGILGRDLKTSMRVSSGWYKTSMKLSSNQLHEGDFVRYVYKHYKELDKALLLRRDLKNDDVCTNQSDTTEVTKVIYTDSSTNTTDDLPSTPQANKKPHDNQRSGKKRKDKPQIVDPDTQTKDTSQQREDHSVIMEDDNKDSTPTKKQEGEKIHPPISLRRQCNHEVCTETSRTNATAMQYGSNIIDLSNEVNRLRGVISEIFGSYPVELYTPIFKQLSAGIIDSYAYMPEFMRFINPAVLAQYALAEDDKVMNVFKITVIEDRRHTLIGIVNTRILRQIFTTKNFNHKVLNQPMVKDIGAFAHALVKDVLRELDIPPSGIGKEVHALLSQIKLMNSKLTSTSTNQDTFFQACQGMSTYVREENDDISYVSPPDQYLCRSRSDSVVSVESASSSRMQEFKQSDDILKMIEMEKQRRDKLKKQKEAEYNKK